MKRVKLVNTTSINQPSHFKHRIEPYMNHKKNFYSERYFKELLAFEKRRTSRNKKPICLMLLNLDRSAGPTSGGACCDAVMQVVTSSIRDIDICGWYKFESCIGVIFTALDEAAPQTSIEAIRKKMNDSLAMAVPEEVLPTITITHHMFLEQNVMPVPECKKNGG